MIKRFVFESNKLIIENEKGQIVKNLDLPIAQIIQLLDEKLIVRLLGDKANNQNVICVNSSGDQLWQNQDPDDYQNGGQHHTICPMTGIWLEENKLVAGGVGWARLFSRFGNGKDYRQQVCEIDLSYKLFADKLWLQK